MMLVLEVMDKEPTLGAEAACDLEDECCDPGSSYVSPSLR